MDKDKKEKAVNEDDGGKAMNKDSKAKLVCGIQLAIVVFYIIYAIRSEVSAPLKVRVKAQKKIMKKAQKQALKEIRKENIALSK